jgi:uncharacterized protein (TIGR03437 family)
LPLFSVDRGPGRYIVVLEDAAVAERVSSERALPDDAARAQREKIAGAQRTMRRELETRKIRVLGSTRTVLNAIFVAATREEAVQIRNLPGVKLVAPARRLRRQLDQAAPLINAPAAWSALGGVGNAGAGIKIGILDTGIDQNQAAFQDASLSPPAAFPICPQDCSYTNNKVIVARSYVAQLAAGTGTNPAANSRPDDLSPRDRVGHGTAVAMIAAGETNSGPAATITGIAPKAFLGNYKIFGSPGVNDYTFSDVVIQALEDALNDGMDVVNLSIGDYSAVYGPLDQSSTCGGACDVVAAAVENTVASGVTVVVAAGDDGSNGVYYPANSTIDSPGTAPSAITVGATTNSHVFLESVIASGGAGTLAAVFGDGPRPAAPLTAPLVDAATAQNDGFACSALGPLNGAIVLITRGGCSFETKILNAQGAGAVGAIVYLFNPTDTLFQPLGLANTTIPSALILNTDGLALKASLQSNPAQTVTMDPTERPAAATPNTVASFSSEGPAIGTFGLKPEVAAVGQQVYTATQTYDPNSDMYDPSGYAAFPGTSFAAPMAAGAAALVKQNNPGLTAGQLKSAVVNSATQDVTDYYGTASVLAVGAGKLNVAGAVQSNVTAVPATLSFGPFVSGVAAYSLPKSIALKISNTSQGPLNLSFKIVVGVPDTQAKLTVSPASLALNAGQSGTVTVTLSGHTPYAGEYEGALTIQGGSVPLRVPYVYYAPDGVPYNIFPVLGNSFTGVATTDADNPVAGPVIGFKVVDQSGLPVQGVEVYFASSEGGGGIGTADLFTDVYGIAVAQTTMGNQVGDQEFLGQEQYSGLTAYFDGVAIPQPVIAGGGVVDAASGQPGNGLAPGSYISIFGSALSLGTKVESTLYLPLSLSGVSVSFDDPPSGLSVPGHLAFISPGQINVQLPWECQGLSSVQMKVSLGDISTAVYTVPLATYSPAAFQYTESSTGLQLAAVLDESYALVGSNNPARAGHTIQIFANGLGPVNSQPPSGEASPASPPATTAAVPTVTIGGLPATVEFSGLTPGSVGLYQLNVVVPSGLASGVQQVVIAPNGVASPPSNLPVQ